ncbi:hypothetical protein RB614_23670 [Phytohabitans sp. ZYX-F-186]|uniref:Uncharacterized protein n=1 Tax=Phytohabitans maris TaxID=3071409 RepID=A0ABU0ZKL2_9ACTN|nr:hypothetical protein [Phytohabitans sp. ZYX-F-186]MDQ7907523.1 hypothetical protein [Phytohabitans sp. ZYX-F-186]
MRELTCLLRRHAEWREAPDPVLRGDRKAIVAPEEAAGLAPGDLVVVPWATSCDRRAERRLKPGFVRA